MSKLDPFVAGVHHASASVPAGPASEVVATDFLAALAVAVSFMLITFAVEWLWKTLRTPAVTATVLGGLAVTGGVLMVAAVLR
jgi:hypothetical protein